MPRNVKESDDECENKGGRRTRTMLNPSVLDSPLRRSSRIRQPVAQNDASPEYSSDVSSTSGTKSTRRRTTALDSINLDTQRNLRTRRNSAASDVSELTENDSATESVSRRITRRSIATVPSVEAPSKLPPKTRRTTRAGSETKSTPPVGRVTRRTRASSMEPEITDDLRSQRADTPVKARKRASAMPSEPAVAEESEDFRMDKSVLIIDEDESETSPNVSETSRRKSKSDTTEDEKMEVDETPVLESEVDTTDKSYDEKTENSCEISVASVTKILDNEEELMAVSDSMESNEKSPKRQSVSSLPKGSPYTIENLLAKSTEPGEESPSNKENKISNTDPHSPVKTTQAPESRVSPRRSINSSFTKITERRCSVTLDNGLVSVYQETKMIAKAQALVATNAVPNNEVSTPKDFSLDAKCVVVLEPMDIKQITTPKDDSIEIGNNEQPPNVEEKEEKEISKFGDKLENSDDRTNEICVTRVIDVINLEPISEPLTDGESSIKLTESEENNEIIFCDETTSDSTVTFLRDRSPDKRVSGDSQENVEISCETVTKTIIPEAGENEEVSLKLVEEIASKPEEEIAPEPKDEIASKPEGEMQFCKIASPNASSINDKVSTAIEMPKECEVNDENDIDESLKDRNSSIVTESPARGEGAEESAKEPEVTKKRRSVGESGSERAENKQNVEEDDGMQVFETDDDNESIVCPYFRDIPADESTEGGNNEENATSNADRDSIHSYSTERNGSECEFALVEKDPWQSVKRLERENIEENTNSDSDDTVIAKFDKESNVFVEIRGKRVDGKKLGEDELLNDEMPIDVSSDVIDDNEQQSNASKKSPKKRASLDNSMKNLNENEQILENRATKSPLNVSKRKSLVDDDANDTVDPEANVSRKSLNKSLKKRSLNASQQNGDPSDNESNLEINKSSKSPKSEQTSRKSLLGSAKKANSSVLDTSKSENRKSLNKSRLDSQEREDTATEEIEKKSRRSESKRNSLNKSNVDQTSLDVDDEEENDSAEKLNKSSKSEGNGKSLNGRRNSRNAEQTADPLENLNDSSKSEGNRKSLNGRRNSKNSEEIAESSENLNKSSKSDSVRELVDNGKESEVELESSGSEIERYENLLQTLNESTKSTKSRKSLNNKNASKIQEQSSESEIEAETDSPAKLNRSSKSINDRKSLNNKNASKIQEQSSESEIEAEIDSPAKLNQSSKSTNDRKSLNNKNASKIQEQSSESEIEAETDSPAKLNRSSKSTNDRKSLNNKNASKIQEQSSESEIEAETDSPAKLNQSSKSTNDRKSLNNKNASKIQEQSSESEIEAETDSPAKLNRSSKSTGDRKSLKSQNASKIQEQSFEAGIEEEKSNLNQSTKSTSDRKSLNNKNTSKIQEQSAESEIEEEKSKLNRSKKSTSDRKSLNNKNTSKIQKQNSESETGSPAKLNRSSKSTGDRKSLSSKNASKIEEQNSESEIEEEKSKLKSTRKSLSENNRSIKDPMDDEDDSESGSSDNEDNSSQKLPLFLYDANTGSEDEASEKSIDADVVNEMNLHGKTDLVYSDDDVQGDDCMVTESESSDSENDNGEDLKDFVVNDDEYDSEEDGELELGDDERESSNSARRVKTKKRKRIIPKPQRDSDSSDSENEEETSKISKTSFSRDDSVKQIKTPTNKKPNESLKAKNAKSPTTSSTLESDENSQSLKTTSSSLEKSETSKTPKNSSKRNESIEKIDEVMDLNESVQGPTKKMQKLLSHSSTPKLSPQKKTLEKLSSPKSAKLDNSKLETSRKSLKTETNTTIETPARLSMSLKDPKTPKTRKSQLHTSLPTVVDVSGDKTILSNVKSPKLLALHQTMTTIVSDNSESRFLMKEKLNESLPPLKLAQRAKELRRSVSEKLRKEENLVEEEIIEEIVEPEVTEVEKKKKKKKKNKGAVDDVMEDSSEALSKETLVSNESQESVETDVASKKSKKRKRNKKQAETMEIEETEVTGAEAMPIKKKQKRPELNEEIVHEVVEKKKKKQKSNVVEESVEEPEKKKKNKKKHVTIVNPEVTIENTSKIIQSETGENSGKLSSRIKRLPEDVLESLSQSVERPKKRRKISKEEQILPSKTMFSPGGKTERNIKVDDDYISLSSFGGTTQFESVDLSKLTKKSNKKSTVVQSFRERMLSRNPRQPISAYLMYQQKQKASGKGNCH